jgi:hypothetical protein
VTDEQSEQPTTDPGGTLPPAPTNRLEAGESRYRGVVESLHEGILVRDGDRTVVCLQRGRLGHPRRAGGGDHRRECRDGLEDPARR